MLQTAGMCAYVISTPTVVHDIAIDSCHESSTTTPSLMLVGFMSVTVYYCLMSFFLVDFGVCDHLYVVSAICTVYQPVRE